MRIIAGQHRGRTLRAPAGRQTRPTSDRVREAMFNLVAARFDVHGARVLDLFAGSGALGCEALSRGALRCVFVDASRAAVAAVRDNVNRVGGEDVEVIDGDALVILGRRGRGEFDLVFLDPPYASTDNVRALALLAERGSPLADDGLIVVEHSAELSLPAGLSQVTSRKYGDTRVTLTRRAASLDNG